MGVKAKEINEILQKYGFRLMFDMIHDEREIRKWGKNEPNLDRKKYLTIKTPNGKVFGRVYTKNTDTARSIDSIELDEKEVKLIITFFKYFVLKDTPEIYRELVKKTGVKEEELKVEIITNNVYSEQKPRRY